MSKKKNMPIHKWTDKLKLKYVEDVIARNKSDVPRELLLVIDNAGWIDWKDKYDRLHMALENVVAYVQEQWEVDEEDRQSMLKVAGLPPDYIDYKAKFKKVQEANLELMDEVADLKEAEAEWTNDATARNRERANMQRELEELRVAGAEPSDLEEGDPGIVE